MKTIVDSQLSKGQSANISQELFDQLLTPTLDLSIDYSEIYLDDLIDNDAIKEIPIIKTIVGVIKGSVSINQFWFAKKLLTFIREFNKKAIDIDKINKFKNKLKSDPQFGKRVAERLMVYIDRNIEINQTLIVANLFSAYIDEKIDFQQLNNIIITLDQLNPKAFYAFFDLAKIDFLINTSNYKDIGQRNHEMENFINNSGFGKETSVWFHGFELTDDGKLLFEYGIKPIKETE
ncbi:MAG: hypothetical protein Q8909_17955 [Bacteroidota bacterium]|nr:hypothetical protein [Bacteroidota bacterium]